MIDSLNFRFKKKGNCMICVVKSKVLISFTVTAKLIYAFVFACPKCWFSYVTAHFISKIKKTYTLLGPYVKNITSYNILLLH